MRRSGVFIVNLKHISHFLLVFLLLTLSRQKKSRKNFVSRKLMGGLVDRWIGNRREMSNYIKVILMPNNIAQEKLLTCTGSGCSIFSKKNL